MREALAGLTVRGRAFLAAGVTAIVCAVVLGQDALTRVGVLVLALPLVTACRHRAQPLPARAGPHRHPAAGRRRAAGPGQPVAHQRGPDARAACCCSRTTSPTCSAPGRGSCSRASATAGAGT